MTTHAERLAEALELLTCSIDAAYIEGWAEALAEGDIERIRDLWNRRIAYHVPDALTSLAAYRTRAPEPAGDDVERVARAIAGHFIATFKAGFGNSAEGYNAEYGPLDDDVTDTAIEETKEFIQLAARAAIAAMRTPSAQEPQG